VVAKRYFEFYRLSGTIPSHPWDKSIPQTVSAHGDPYETVLIS